MIENKFKPDCYLIITKKNILNDRAKICREIYETLYNKIV